jgi:Eukaryotic aspartyl protease
VVINAYCDTVDLSQSTTGQLLDDTTIPLNFSYGSGDVLGDYITDNIAVGGASLTNVIIGLASDDTNEEREILDVGLPADEAPGISEHAGVLELLVQQGYISSTSYSLYLDRYGKLSL